MTVIKKVKSLLLDNPATKVKEINMCVSICDGKYYLLLNQEVSVTKRRSLPVIVSNVFTCVSLSMKANNRQLGKVEVII